MKSSASLLVLAVFSAAVTAAVSACGRTAPTAAHPAESKLIHGPPVAKLSDEQLRSLSMDCEKYVPDKTTRGPYDAAYCESAMAAWADAPIQMLPFGKEAPAPQSSASPR
jgi:hypothetical protein